MAKNIINNDSTPKQIWNATGVSRLSAELMVNQYIETRNFYTASYKLRKFENTELVAAIQRILTDDCTLTLEQIKQNLPDSVIASKSTISRILKNMGWSRKRVKTIPTERNSLRVINMRH